MSSDAQLDEAIHELDDIFLELQSLDQIHSLKRNDSRNSYVGGNVIIGNDDVVTSPNLQLQEHSKRNSLLNLSHNTGERPIKRAGPKSADHDVGARSHDYYATPNPRKGFPLRPSSGYYSEDDVYRHPMSPLVPEVTYQRPRPRGSHRYATNSYQSTRRLFSDPTQEIVHGSLATRFGTVGGAPSEYSALRTPPRRRIANDHDFPRPLNSQGSSPSRTSSNSAQFRSPAMMSGHAESDYDEVPNEANNQVFSGYDDGVPDYDEINDLPAETTAYCDDGSSDVIRRDITGPNYDANGTLPFEGEVGTERRPNPNVKYTQVKIKNSRPEMVIEMRRLSDTSSEPVQENVTMANDDKMQETAFHQSNGMAEVRRMTTQLGINFDDDEWDDVSRRASRMTIGPPDVPVPVGPVIDATKQQSKQTSKRYRCRCHLAMSILSVLAIALFLFALGAYIYIGVNNDKEISERYAFAGWK